MRFCRECNNMLYPTENRDTKSLKFICKNCNFSELEEIQSEETSCVYRNDIRLKQLAIIIDPCITEDPTYSRTKNFPCPNCGHNEAIFFQNPNTNDTGMKLIFVCCRKSGTDYCGKWWFNKT
jgi:DNA-directed RNA polymerase II subunit RPB9